MHEILKPIDSLERDMYPKRLLVIFLWKEEDHCMLLVGPIIVVYAMIFHGASGALGQSVYFAKGKKGLPRRVRR